ncbi:MAG: hypothetical protein EZS28_029740, partial [Streblomastix strix]
QLISRPQIQEPFQRFCKLNLLQDTVYSYIDNRSSLKTLLSSSGIFKPLEYNKLNNRTYQLHQYEAQWANRHFNLAFQQSQFKNEPKTRGFSRGKLQ